MDSPSIRFEASAAQTLADQAREIDDLRSTVKALDKRIEGLKAALRFYASHEWPCAAWHPRGPAEDPRCDCGLRAALSGSSRHPGGDPA